MSKVLIALGILGIICLVLLVLTVLDRFANDNRVLNETYFTGFVVVLSVVTLFVIIALARATYNIKLFTPPGSRERMKYSPEANKAAKTAIIKGALQML